MAKALIIFIADIRILNSLKRRSIISNQLDKKRNTTYVASS